MTSQTYEIGVQAARMEKHAAWTWGEAIVVEAGWEPPGHGGRTPNNSKSSLNSYREQVAREAGLELAELPSEETLRHRAAAFYYAREYREEVAISTAYEAAIAVTAGRWDGTVGELLEAARNDQGRITVDGVRAVLDRPPATIRRPQDGVQHVQRAGQHLRDAAEDFINRTDVVDPREVENAVVALRQVVQVATILIDRLEGRAPVDGLLQEILDVA